MGGGTGTSVVLGGLKKYPVNLSAIITTADDGSSSGVLRRKYGMIPPGDIRRCLVALASGEFGYLNERFEGGFLGGHTLGNFLITLFYQRNRDFQGAIDELVQMTGAQGAIIPMTLRPVTLIAKLSDGRKIRGEKNITPSQEISTKLARLCISPSGIEANPRALAAVEQADAIIVGPGNFFSSILPIFLVENLKEAVRRSRAKKIYVANLFTQKGHTDTFTLSDFLKIFLQYIGEDIFTHILANSHPIPRAVVEKYANEMIGAAVQIPKTLKKDERFIGRPLANAAPRPISVFDPIAKMRTPFLHNQKKLARAIMELV